MACRQQRILSAQVFELHRMLQVQQELLPQASMPPPSWHYPLSGPQPPRPKEAPSWPSIHSTQVDPTAATAATAATARFAYPAYSTATQSTCAQNPPHAHLEKVVAIAMVRQEGGERGESAGWMGVRRLAEEGDRVGRWSFEAPYERRSSHPQTSEASTASERPLGGAWGGGGDSSAGMRSGAGREWAHGWGSTPGREWEGGRLGGDVGEKRVGGGGRRELELFPLVPAGDEGGVDFRLSPRMGTKIVPRALVGTPESTAGILASIQRQ